jgi:cytochrome P450
MFDLEASVKRWRVKYGDNFTILLFGNYLTIITKYIDLKKYYNASDKMLSLDRAYKIIMGSAIPDSQYLVNFSAIPYLQKIMTPRHLQYMTSNIETASYDYFNTKNGKFWIENGNEVVVDFFDFMYHLILRMNVINFASARIYKNHVDELIKLFTQLDIEKHVLNPITHRLKKRFGLISKRDIIWEQWIELMMPDIERRLKMIENNVKPTDIDIMYETVQNVKEDLEKDGQLLTPRLVALLPYSFMFSAQFNSYTTAALVMIEWLRHEHDEIGRRIKEEIDHAPPMGELTIEYLNSMEFVEACIYEVIRLGTNSQLSFRHAGQDIPLSDEKYILAGNFVATVSTRAEDLYVNPEKFDPDRHLAPREENKADPYRVTPFGRGRHPCAGERYVKMEIKVMLIYLSKMCKVELMEESKNFETTINKKQLQGVSRPTKPIFVKISKKEQGN